MCPSGRLRGGVDHSGRVEGNQSFKQVQRKKAGSKIKQDKGTAPAEPPQVTLSGNARHFYGGLPVVYRCFRIFGGCYDRGQETGVGARLGVTKPDSLRDTRVFPCANAGA